LIRAIEIKKISCSDNLLANFDYGSLNPKRLFSLNIVGNNLPEQDLSVFSKFINLEVLLVGNGDQEKIKQNIYNRFAGSLEPLKSLIKLKKLYISNTDIDSGVEHLPTSLEEIYCSSFIRPNSQVKEVSKRLITSDYFDFDKEYGGRYQRN